jgi:hypothetical protein
MDYKNFYLVIRRYAKKKISRGMFLIDWRDAQRGQGIEAGKLNVRGYGRKTK